MPSNRESVLGELRKQGLIVVVALIISIVLAFLAFLERKSALPKGISLTAMYATLLFVWPCFSSISGGLLPAERFRQTAENLSGGGIAKRLAARLLQAMTALLLSLIAIATALEVLARIPLHLRSELPWSEQRWAMYFKDAAYLILADGSFRHGDSWFRFNFYDGAYKLLLGVFGSLICFSCALLFSSLLTRAKVAATTGYFVGMSISWLIVHCWIRLDLPGLDDVLTLLPGELPWILCVLAISAMLIFILALLLSSSPARRTCAPVILGSVLSCGLATIAFFAFAYPHSIRLSPRSALAVWPPLLTADGKNILVEAVNFNSWAPQIWCIPVEGKNITPLTGRLAHQLTLSPDGNWVGYLSQRNVFGFARESVDLRAVRMNGTQDRLLASGLTNNPYFTLYPCGGFAFSPDSSRIALACDDVLVVAELNGARPVRIPLPPIRCRLWLVAWNISGSEVLVAPDPWTISRTCLLLAYNLKTGGIRTVRENPECRHYFVFPSTPKGIQYVLFGNSLMDITTGKEQQITESDCYAAGMSPDRKFLVYATARQDSDRHYQTEIYWRDLASGRDEMVASFQGLLSEPFLVSPMGDQILANDNSEPMNERAIIVENTGAVKRFPPGWMAFGWANNSEIGLSKPLEKSLPIALGESATMRMRIVIP